MDTTITTSIEAARDQAETLALQVKALGRTIKELAEFTPAAYEHIDAAFLLLIDAAIALTDATRKA